MNRIGSENLIIKAVTVTASCITTIVLAAAVPGAKTDSPGPIARSAASVTDHFISETSESR